MPKCNLRSAGKNLLTVPVTRTATSARAFKSYGPKVWNNLPAELRHSCDFYDPNFANSDFAVSVTNTFKNRLKTVLFATAFGS